jgi:hypothetical protein
LTSLALHHCLRPSTLSLAQASPPRGPSLQSLQLALHACNRSIKSSLVLSFSTLVTWLHVIFHMQWAPSSHMYLWTNFLCISHKHILVHLGCHSITKTKQGPFTVVATCWWHQCAPPTVTGESGNSFAWCGDSSCNTADVTSSLSTLIKA